LNYILNIRYIFIRNLKIVIRIFIIHIFPVLFYSHKSFYYIFIFAQNLLFPKDHYVLQEVVLSSIIDLCEDINFPWF